MPHRSKSIQYIGLKFLGRSFVLCPFTVQNLFFCSSVRNCIACANDASTIVNKDFPYGTTKFSQHNKTKFIDVMNLGSSSAHCYAVHCSSGSKSVRPHGVE